MCQEKKILRWLISYFIGLFIINAVHIRDDNNKPSKSQTSNNRTQKYLIVETSCKNRVNVTRAAYPRPLCWVLSLFFPNGLVKSSRPVLQIFGGVSEGRIRERELPKIIPFFCFDMKMNLCNIIQMFLLDSMNHFRLFLNFHLNVDDNFDQHRGSLPCLFSAIFFTRKQMQRRNSQKIDLQATKLDFWFWFFLYEIIKVKCFENEIFICLKINNCQ